MKIKEFQSILKEKKIDFALFYSVDFERIEHNMIYFSQYNGIGALVIPKTKKPFMIAPKMELKKARESKIKVYQWDKKKRLFEQVKSLTKGKKIAIDKNNFSLNDYKELKKQFKKIKSVDIAKKVLKLRETKTKEEIKIIKKAFKIANDILKLCLKNFKKFKTEGDVKAYLEHEAKKKGCGLSFPTIVASGKDAVKPHHNTRNKTLQKGFCVIDFGIIYNHYCTDVTRTVYIGKPTKKEREIYNLLLNVQKNIIKNLKLNKKCNKIYNETKELGKYFKYFTHGLGHGVGVKIHELPNLTEKSKDCIKNNQVFTIEPGIYLKNFGIRIEDSILIEKGKINILTKIPKELILR